MICEKSVEGIPCYIIGNQWVEVTVLAGKGGDIYQIMYYPKTTSNRSTGCSLLHTQGQNLSLYRDRDLSEKRLERYSQDSTGGWQDVIPGFGKSPDTMFREFPVGLAATVSWECSGYDPDSEELELRVKLSDFPVSLIKRIMVKDSSVVLRETVCNDADDDIDMTWTQHSVFGGDFLMGTVDIDYPSDEVFLCAAHAAAGGERTAYIHPLSSVPMPDGGIRDFHRLCERCGDGNLVFTLNAEEGAFTLSGSQSGIRVRMNWDKEVFPYVRCWYQNTKDYYSMALEPCNYYYSTFADTDRENMYLHLAAGMERTTEITLEMTLTGPL